ncbi:MAG: biotin transporter BioY [Eubacteriales bacterium]|nr:biotin transporter BioY [Eubacteriales bacterium]
MNNKKILDTVYIGVFAALMAVCSWIMVPAAVPVTLQTMGVFTAVGILGGKRGTLAVLVYILLGALGLPVFAGFSGGIGILLGSTGGYIGGFLLSALVMWLFERLWGRGKLVLAISMVVGLLVCYAVGTLWFMAVYTRTTGPVGLAAVLGWCVIPFIVPDLVKIALSMLLAGRLRRFVK